MFRLDTCTVIEMKTLNFGRSIWVFASEEFRICCILIAGTPWRKIRGGSWRQRETRHVGTLDEFSFSCQRWY